MTDSAWQRNGITLLWNEDELAKVGGVAEACSLHAFMSMRHDWPEDLPSQDGRAVVVAGLDMFLDLMPPDDAMQWLEGPFREILMDFQGWGDGHRALIFWLPQGQRRIRQQHSVDQFAWVCQGRWSGQSLDLGRVLWSGASQDAFFLTNSGTEDKDWLGLHLKRIS
jgi:hypothetical protein